MLEMLDPKLGRMRLRLWCNLHFQQSAKTKMHLFQVEQLDAALIRTARPLWLIWVGEGIPKLSQIWRQYLRRFAVDHWYRFAKQRQHLPLPRLGTREQCERWSDLMPLLTWQLWESSQSCERSPPTLAEASHQFDAWKSGSVDGRSFSRDWHTITSS